jgi:hypothetical protein
MSTSYTRAQEATILNQNDQAPFRGTLIPESTLSQMMLDIREKKHLSSQLQQCLDAEPVSVDNNQFEWGLSGFGFGILTSIVLVYSLK